MPDPSPGPDEILIEVVATSVNRADLAQRAGRHDPGLSRPDQPLVAGMDAAGVVSEVGADVAAVQPGDRVMGLVRGGYAAKAILDARLAIPVPDAWTLVEGAAAVSGLQTEYDALANAAQLQPGEAVVIHGASAPVGLTGFSLRATSALPPSSRRREPAAQTQNCAQWAPTSSYAQETRTSQARS